MTTSNIFNIYCTRHQTGCGVVRSGGETYVVVVGGCCTVGSERRVEIYDVQEQIWIRGECPLDGYCHLTSVRSSEFYCMYTVAHPLIYDILLNIFWEIPLAGGLIL